MSVNVRVLRLFIVFVVYGQPTLQATESHAELALGRSLAVTSVPSSNEGADVALIIGANAFYEAGVFGERPICSGCMCHLPEAL